MCYYMCARGAWQEEEEEGTLDLGGRSGLLKETLMAAKQGLKSCKESRGNNTQRENGKKWERKSSAH